IVYHGEHLPTVGLTERIARALFKAATGRAAGTMDPHPGKYFKRMEERDGYPGDKARRRLDDDGRKAARDQLSAKFERGDSWFVLKPFAIWLAASEHRISGMKLTADEKPTTNYRDEKIATTLSNFVRFIDAYGEPPPGGERQKARGGAPRARARC